MKAKRKPGGGRKPRGPFSKNSAMMTVRMPDDLRRQLKGAADKKGWSLTQELLWRVQDSLNREHDKRRDPALKALNFAIGQLVERISGGMYTPHEGLRQEELKEWRTDPFKFKALRFAVSRLLDALQPSGEMRPGESDAEAKKTLEETFGVTGEVAELITQIHKTPEAYGDFAFTSLWAQLTRSTPLTEKEKDYGRRYPQFGKVMELEFYGFAQARADLRVGKRP